MRATSLGGRGLWPLVLTMTVALVAADFLRQPLHGPENGVAAPPASALVLWVPGVNAGSSAERLAGAAAERLDRPWRPVRSQLVHGGSTSAVTTLLARRGGSTPPLLLVDAGTVADIERDRRGSALPTIAAEGERAARLLRHAVPVALLAEDPLVVATSGRSSIHSPEELFTTMRRDPGGAVFGLAPDAWSRTALAALVHSVGVDGDVRYRVLPTADAAVIARAGDLADVVIAPRSELHRLPLARGLRLLAQSDSLQTASGSATPAGASARAAGPIGTAGPTGAAGPTGPPVARLGDLLGDGAAVAHAQRWIAIVAPPGTNARTRRALTRQLTRITATVSWQATLRRLALSPAPRATPARYLALARSEQDKIAVDAGHVAQRAARRR
ncbi:hypothetical protein [Conexibacter sp. CPCC 206217]|uniref:hypothetical protein n=1 Tax=Conexibacter sp. CPCC 206217 TaxID=3064574 RepID=UPI00271FBD89|nr:hypothetical protein [Conexibacter sp. CPCC 206217]MDO8209333.1 hypothetical protein [Conexibacter sp. CPCC 206217]